MAVYEVYVNYFSYGAQYVTTETKMYEIPSSADNVSKLVDPKVKTEMGKTGSFEFSMYYGHPYYACWHQMKTMLRVTYYGETIFYGRVLTIDVDHITTKKTIHCEGYLAFLMDSQQEGVADADRTAILGSAYVSQLLTNHNTQVANIESQMTVAGPNKRFQLGMMPGNYSGADDNQQIKMEPAAYKYGSSSWEETASAFSGLIKSYGGYLRTRYVDANTVYLDWLESYFRSTISDRVIEIGTNVISMSSSSEVENIFTVLIPIGKNMTNSANSDAVMLTPKELYVKDIGSVYTDEDLNVGYHSKSDYTNSLNQYGMIVKSQSFQNADTVAKLREYAWDYIKNNYHGGLTSFTVSAIDMKVLGGSDIILAGDQVRVRYVVSNNNGSPVWESKILTVLSAEYDLLHPEKNSYGIGIPDNALNKTYGTSAEKSSNSSASSKGGGGGIHKKKQEEDQNAQNNKVDHDFYAITYSAAQNNKEYQEFKAQYGDEAAGVILRTQRLVLDQAIDEEGKSTEVKKAKQVVKTWIFDGINGTLNGYSVPDNVDPTVAEQIYKVNSSMAISSFGQLEVREQYDAVKEWADIDAQTYGRGKTVLLMGIGKTTNASEVQQYGVVYTKAAARSKNTGTTTTEKTTTKTNGLLGTFGAVASKYSPEAGAQLEQMVDDLTGTVNGSVNIFGNTANVNLTNLYQQAGVTIPGFETMNFSGNAQSGEGKATIGRRTDSQGRPVSGYNVTLNDQQSYNIVDGQGHTQTVTTTGFVNADDYHIENVVDSFKTTMAYVNTLLADYAQVGTLVAMEARIGDIEADYITADYITGSVISSALTTSDSLSIKSLSCTYEGYFSGNLSTAANLFINGHQVYVTNVKKSQDGKSLIIYYTNGTNITFEKGDTEAAYNQGWNDCIDAASGGYYLDDYSTYNGGTSVYLYVAPTGGAQAATGSKQVWRYGGSSVYRYTLPARK